MHTISNHWIVATSIDCPPSEIKIYDSLYKTIDESTRNLVALIFGEESTIHVAESQKQQGGSDCGVLAIATCTALAHNKVCVFKQEAMRRHLHECFYSDILTPFLKLLYMHSH